jgi:molybdopterin-guanine dinucleotide biosynthesis protein A
MGRPKDAIILPDGTTMVEHVLASLRTVCRRLVLVGASCTVETPLPSDVTQIHDLHAGLGPLSGLEALLSTKSYTGYLVLTCDQPLVTSSLLRRLLDGDFSLPHFFKSEDGTRLHPFPGYYPAALLPEIEASISRREHSVRRLLDTLDCHWITIGHVESSYLRSFDTPSDLEDLQHLLTSQDTTHA